MKLPEPEEVFKNNCLFVGCTVISPLVVVDPNEIKTLNEVKALLLNKSLVTWSLTNALVLKFLLIKLLLCLTVMNLNAL